MTWNFGIHSRQLSLAALHSRVSKVSVIMATITAISKEETTSFAWQ